MIRAGLWQCLAVPLMFCAPALAPVQVSAQTLVQSQDAGGMTLGFGVKAVLERQGNRTLDPARPGQTETAETALSFDLRSQTRFQKFALRAGAVARKANGPASVTPAQGLSDLSFAVLYDRETAATLLTFAAHLDNTDLSQIADIPATGSALATGTATRQRADAQLGLEWGRNRPVGFGLTAQLENTSYRNGLAIGLGGGTLNDIKRQTVTASLRLDLTRANSLGHVLSYRRFSTAGTAGQRTSVALDSTLRIARPRGDLDLALGFTDTDDGHRWRGSIARALSYPLGTMNVQLGVARGVTAKSHLTGAFRIGRALPRGGIDAQLYQTLASSNETDTERLETGLGVRLRTEIAPHAALIVQTRWTASKETQSNLGITASVVEVTYTRDLLPDVTLELGLRHRRRNDDVAGAARSTEVFISLGRVFLARY